jgi:hypothetical protein
MLNAYTVHYVIVKYRGKCCVRTEINIVDNVIPRHIVALCTASKYSVYDVKLRKLRLYGNTIISCTNRFP